MLFSPISLHCPPYSAEVFPCLLVGNSSLINSFFFPLKRKEGFLAFKALFIQDFLSRLLKSVYEHSFLEVVSSYNLSCGTGFLWVCSPHFQRSQCNPRQFFRIQGSHHAQNHIHRWNILLSFTGIISSTNKSNKNILFCEIESVKAFLSQILYNMNW